MLVAATGLTKSASSVLYNLSHAVLQHSGHDQTAWRNEDLPALAAMDGVAVSRTGFMPTDFESAVMPALKQSGFERWCAVKTNGGLVQKCRSLMDVGLFRAVASYRDPGEASVSLLDYVERQIAEGGPDRVRLAHIITLRDAIDHVAARTAGAATWLRDPRVIKISYDQIKSDPASVCAALASGLGLDLADPEAAARAAGAAASKPAGPRFAAEADASDRAYAAGKFADYQTLVRQLSPSPAIGRTG